MDTEKVEKSFDESGEKVLIEGEFRNVSFMVGIAMSVAGMIFSFFNIINPQEGLSSGIDYMIVIFAVLCLVMCIKELLLNRNRKLSVTNNRVYGNTGRDSFDFLYSNISGVELKIRKSVIYGSIQYLSIKTSSNAEVNIEQLKNLERISQVIKSKLEE